LKDNLSRSSDPLEFIIQSILLLLDQGTPVARSIVEMLLELAFDGRYLYSCVFLQNLNNDSLKVPCTQLRR
jgi:hypothetical protein